MLSVYKLMQIWYFICHIKINTVLECTLKTEKKVSLLSLIFSEKIARNALCETFCISHTASVPYLIVE